MAAQVRRTKIVATIGPASGDTAVLEALIEAGMDGARLNMSHGTPEDHATLARRVRAAHEGRRPVALIADLQGPKLRVGDLAETVELERGGSVVIAGEDAARDGEEAGERDLHADGRAGDQEQRKQGLHQAQAALRARNSSMDALKRAASSTNSAWPAPSKISTIGCGCRCATSSAWFRSRGVTA